MEVTLTILEDKIMNEEFKPIIDCKGEVLDFNWIKRNRYVRDDGCWQSGNSAHYHFRTDEGFHSLYLPKYVYQLTHGRTKVRILHTCGNLKCINPDHLVPAFDKKSSTGKSYKIIKRDYNQAINMFDSCDDLEEFLFKYNKVAYDDDCLVCLTKQATHPFKINGKWQYFSLIRLMYGLKHDGVDNETILTHTCGNINCINPDHIVEADSSCIKKYFNDCGIQKLKKGKVNVKELTEKIGVSKYAIYNALKKYF